MSVARQRLVLGSRRELGTVAVVSAVTGLFAAVLVLTAESLPLMSDSGAAALLFVPVAWVFIGLSLYVSAVVTANCVATVLAGRQGQLALLRLLGADAPQLRRVIASGCAWTGLVGALAGAALGTGITIVTRAMLVSRGTLPDAGYPWLAYQLPIAVLTIVATSTLAGWAGSATVLRIAPAQAMSGVSAPAAGAGPVWRGVLGSLLVAAGAAILVIAMIVGERGSAAGFLLAFAGSVLSGTGLLIGARLFIPAVVAGLGLLLGRRAEARIARRNAVLDPRRTTNSTMGLVLGVTLVTTFASGTSALRQSVSSWGMTAAQQVEADRILVAVSAVLIALVVVSSVIAAVGFVSTMSLTVLQRRRELGLLRALGFTAAQVRAMITAESVALSVAAMLFGVLLGIGYGTAGAQSLIGVLNEGFVWGVPWPVLAATAVACVLLVIVSSQSPARRAVRVSPIDALRVDA